MGDVQMLRDKGILRTNIVVEGAFWKWAGTLLVRRGGGLAVSKEGWDDDEVLGGVECLSFSYQPEVVR